MHNILETLEEIELKQSRDPIKCFCVQCNKIFFNPKNLVKRILKGYNRGKYCSKECFKVARTPITVKKICLHCNTEFKTISNVQKFCSRSCSAKYNRCIDKGKILKCLYCGKDMKYRTNKQFCSIQCSANLKKYQIIQNWLNGIYNGSTNKGFCCNTIRNYLIDQSKNTCSKCGWNKANPITNIVPLEINHIDGDSENNKKENLEVLCPNCHSLTPNFRNLNKNSKRSNRWQYY